MKRINKSEARKQYNAGKSIALLPCKMPVNNVWQNPCYVSNKDGETFEAIINSFEYYNCNNQLGKYAAFYETIDLTILNS